MPIITLTTDFGTADGYAAAMKGILLSMAPQATLVDATHEILPQAVRQAAVAVNAFAPYFPPGTIHVIVVDPGVGTDRAILAVSAIGQIFLAPDNGLLSLIFERDPQAQVRRVENRALFRPELSSTFHGRDIFAPVAAHLASGVPFEAVGPATADYILGIIPHAQVSGETVRGRIIYKDHFGNLITNIRREHLAGKDVAAVKVKTGAVELTGLRSAYGEVEKGCPLALIGSAGYLEIAVREGNAAEVLGVGEDEEVEVNSM